MNLEQRSASIQTFKPDAAWIHAQLFIEGLAEKRLTSHSCARRPDDFDGTVLFVDGRRQKISRAAQCRQFNR